MYNYTGAVSSLENSEQTNVVRYLPVEFTYTHQRFNKVWSAISTFITPGMHHVKLKENERMVD